jgi:hypothetical protein
MRDYSFRTTPASGVMGEVRFLLRNGIDNRRSYAGFHLTVISDMDSRERAPKRQLFARPHDR